MHNHSHAHHDPGDGHTHSHQTHLQKKFKFAVLITFCVFLGELIGGIWSGSLALLSDAVHVMSDVFSLLISWLAIYLSTRPATASRTYGYHRAEVFAAFINGVSLIGISGWIFYEAYQRYLSPTEIKVTGMFIVASLGFVGNLIILWQLHGGRNNEWHGNLNVRSAMLHVIGDTLSSVAVVVGGAIIFWTGWHPIDALLSFLIGGIILFGAVNVTREAVHILLENSPRNADAHTVATHLRNLEPVKEVHDMHIWSLCSSYCALSAHVVVDENTTLAPDRILEQINAELKTHFGINHTTLQLEQVACARAGNLLCNAQHS